MRIWILRESEKDMRVRVKSLGMFEFTSVFKGEKESQVDLNRSALKGLLNHLFSNMTIIPISSALVGKGMGLGTVLALIEGEAGASISELIIIGSMFRRELVFAFAVNVFFVAIAAGFLVEWLAY